MIDPMTGRTAVRMLDVHTESYEVARKYMIRLGRKDFEGDADWLKKLADEAKMSVDDFKARFGHLK